MNNGNCSTYKTIEKSMNCTNFIQIYMAIYDRFTNV